MTYPVNGDNKYALLDLAESSKSLSLEINKATCRNKHSYC